MNSSVVWSEKNNSGMSVFEPRHSNGAPSSEDCISCAVAAAAVDGVEVSTGVTRKWAPSGAARNFGGPAFVEWLREKGLELCKSDKSGAWWTVVRISDVIKRDKAGIAIAARNKFNFSGI